MTTQPIAGQLRPSVSARPEEVKHPAFAFLGNGDCLVGSDIAKELERGSLPSLTRRVRSFFADNPNAPMLMGAIPFDRSGKDYLFQTDGHHRDFRKPTQPAPTPGSAQLSAEPATLVYTNAVSDALRKIDAGDLTKVVLSRSLTVVAEAPIDPTILAARLSRDVSVMTFLVSLPAGHVDTSRHIVGATPELLVRKRGKEVLSHPLAGSAPRSPNAGVDAESALKLMQSDKDLREHATVVEAIADVLSPFCASLDIPRRPSPRATASMWHLGTAIRGTLKDQSIPVTDLLDALHPTPAVCGLPRSNAEDAIKTLEGYDRGFYAGAVGTVDRTGDGEWYVTLRCAEIEGERARLYAGAGIVAGSDPWAELKETSAKFVAMLTAFGLGENGGAHP